MTKPALLVFGTSGQVALALQERASQSGIDLVAVGRQDADLTDPDAPEAVIERLAAGRVVVNGAAYTAVDQAETDAETAHAVNAAAPGRMAKACAERTLAFIHLSTDYVFDGRKQGAYVETDPVSPRSVYGRTKLEGEQAVTAAGGRSAILRTAWVYSPFGKNFVRTMLRVGAERNTLRVVHDQRGSPTSAHDIADAILVAAGALARNETVSGLYHLAGSGEASWAEFAEGVFKLASARGGPSATVERITTADYPTPAPRPGNSRLDCTKFEAAFGYRSPHWLQSLESVIDRLHQT